MKAPDDDHRLRPHLRKGESVSTVEPHPKIAYDTDPGGDARALRGVPAIGKDSAASAITGTDPLRALMAKQRRG